MKIGPPFIVGAAVAGCAVGIGSILWQGSLPFKGYSGDSTRVVIEEGRPARVAARTLQESGVVRSALVFRLLMRLRRAEVKVHAGEYEFSGALTPDQVLARLIKGDVLLHRITVPEGLRLEETAQLVQSAGFGPGESFLRLARDPRPIRDLDPEASDLEGYLFPDTYLFARGTPPERILEEMISRFRAEMGEERRARARELGLGVRDVVTLASLVEEEARLDEERDRISAVFHNRLRIGMPLQCDPTVVYALTREGRYRGAIHRSDLALRSPYNTYLHRGLPPGPICSPGGKSLQAALHPSSSRELYFVVSGGGRHRFSTSLDQHQEAVRRYRRDFGRLNRQK